MITNLPTTELERLAIEIDDRDGEFDADVAAWLTGLADERPGSGALVAIMNDPAEPAVIRSRALAMLTADLLRG